MVGGRGDLFDFNNESTNQGNGWESCWRTRSWGEEQGAGAAGQGTERGSPLFLATPDFMASAGDGWGGGGGSGRILSFRLNFLSTTNI